MREAKGNEKLPKHMSKHRVVKKSSGMKESTRKKRSKKIFFNLNANLLINEFKMNAFFPLISNSENFQY